MSESESSQSEESDSEETGEDDSEWERTSRTSRRTSESEDESKSTQKEIAGKNIFVVIFVPVHQFLPLSVLYSSTQNTSHAT